MQGEARGGGAHGVGAGGAGLGDQADGGAGGLQDGLHGGEFVLPAGGGLVQPGGRHRDTREAAEHGAQGAGRLPLGREQPAQIAAELLGEREGGEGLGGGRQVDDHGVVRAVVGGVAQGAQQGQLLAAGQRGELVAVEPVGAEQVEGSGGTFLQGEQVVPEAVVGGEVPGGEPRVRVRPAEHRAEGVGAVGGQHEDPVAGARRGERGARGDGGPPGAAGAGDEKGAHKGERYVSDAPGRRGVGPKWRARWGVRPEHRPTGAATPVRKAGPPGHPPGHRPAEPPNRNARSAGTAGRAPGPTGRTTGSASGSPECRAGPGRRNAGPPAGRRSGRAGYLPVSTRFFRPARARSMMTFSALRLIMPSIGILTSTVSW